MSDAVVAPQGFSYFPPEDLSTKAIRCHYMAAFMQTTNPALPNPIYNRDINDGFAGVPIGQKHKASPLFFEAIILDVPVTVDPTPSAQSLFEDLFPGLAGAFAADLELYDHNNSPVIKRASSDSPRDGRRVQSTNGSRSSCPTHMPSHQPAVIPTSVPPSSTSMQPGAAVPFSMDGDALNSDDDYDYSAEDAEEEAVRIAALAAPKDRDPDVPMRPALPASPPPHEAASQNATTGPEVTMSYPGDADANAEDWDMAAPDSDFESYSNSFTPGSRNVKENSGSLQHTPAEHKLAPLPIRREAAKSLAILVQIQPVSGVSPHPSASYANPQSSESQNVKENPTPPSRAPVERKLAPLPIRRVAAKSQALSSVGPHPLSSSSKFNAISDDECESGSDYEENTAATRKGTRQGPRAVPQAALERVQTKAAEPGKKRASADGRFICTEGCGRSFASSGGRNRHMKDSHSGAEKLKCEHCAKTFSLCGTGRAADHTVYGDGRTFDGQFGDHPYPGARQYGSAQNTAERHTAKQEAEFLPFPVQIRSKGIVSLTWLCSKAEIFRIWHFSRSVGLGNCEGLSEVPCPRNRSKKHGAIARLGHPDRTYGQDRTAAPSVVMTGADINIEIWHSLSSWL
ncbi:hypothetical protein B0H10DRAFT_1945293 [Mycena sp. CBHHK59/15]|nr:hypothetical protein B0H10DRAFT_1945293 [Mycena sp. CBHHK59/15]